MTAINPQVLEEYRKKLKEGPFTPEEAEKIIENLGLVGVSMLEVQLAALSVLMGSEFENMQVKLYCETLASGLPVNETFKLLTRGSGNNLKPNVSETEWWRPLVPSVVHQFDPGKSPHTLTSQRLKPMTDGAQNEALEVYYLFTGAGRIHGGHCHPREKNEIMHVMFGSFDVELISPDRTVGFRGELATGTTFHVLHPAWHKLVPTSPIAVLLVLSSTIHDDENTDVDNNWPEIDWDKIHQPDLD